MTDETTSVITEETIEKVAEELIKPVVDVPVEQPIVQEVVEGDVQTLKDVAHEHGIVLNRAFRHRIERAERLRRKKAAKRALGQRTLQRKRAKGK